MLQTLQTHRCNIIGKAEIDRYQDAWSDLASRAVEDNAYFSPQYAMSLLETVCASQDVQFLTAWKGEKLTGLLPVVRNGLSIRGLRPYGQSWRSVYTFSGMPLLDKSEPEAAATAILAELAEFGPHDWLLKDIYPDGPAFKAFKAALDDLGFPCSPVRSFQRASFGRDHDFEDHLQNQVPAKRRRDLGRNRRRLEKLGDVTHEAHTQGDSLLAAVDIFLEMEASGWKGARGTALACKPDSKEFAFRAFKNPEPGHTRVDLLLLDGKPIACGVIVFGGETAFTIKGAYDEAYGNYSAGLLLEMEVARSFLEEGWACRLDSATAGEHVIDFLWPERRTVSDIMFSCSDRRTESDLAAYSKTDALYRNAKAHAKRLLRR